MIHIHYLEPAGHDRWDRPVFRHRKTGQHFCVVDDLDATLADVRAGTDLYFKSGGHYDGEPEFPVTLCTLPAIVCRTTTSNRMFHEGGVYPAFPQTESASDTPNVFQVQDDLGRWRVMLWDDLRFHVPGGVATFEIVEESQ